MLDYLVTSRVRRELLRLVWGENRSGSVSALARVAKANFSGAHRELEAMSRAGLVATERRGAEVHYRQAPRHPQAKLLRQLMGSEGGKPARSAALQDSGDRVRSWLSRLGAPLHATPFRGVMPAVEDVLTEALVVAHTDATVARVLPIVLWRHRHAMNLERLVEVATQRNEGQALGYFLEMAGRLGNDPSLVKATSCLVDRRRRRRRMFFTGPHGRHALAAAKKRDSALARRWGYLMNADEDSFRSLFDKFSEE